MIVIRYATQKKKRKVVVYENQVKILYDDILTHECCTLYSCELYGC